MKDLHEQSYYELLEIEPNASQEDVLKAYNKARTTYSTNSPALYSLMNKEEAQELLRLIDEAYSVLSNQFKRKHYDKTGAPPEDEFSQPTIIAAPQTIAQTTQEDFAIPSGIAHQAFSETTTQRTAQQVEQMQNPQQQTYSHTHAPQDETVVTTRFGKYKINTEFETSLKTLEDFTGPTLNKIRLYKNISLDQVSEVTKVSRPYLTAIETNDYACLPATVFVRGFLVQLAKALGLNPEKVSSSYLKTIKELSKK
ncbi:MAG: helix-turn-helix domain-containing protein [Oligoflexia bacterium]|nr:helix-turn-helix domain-containing protein [Oligoflexia bacterium]